VKTETIFLTVINNPFDPRDYTRSKPEWSSGKNLGEYISSPYKEIVVSLNGALVPEQEIYSVPVRAGDSIVVCPVPQGGDDKNILRLVAFLAVAIFAPQIALALPGGATAAGALTGIGYAYTAGITMIGGLLINTLLPIKPIMPKNFQDADDSPSYGFAGPKNTSSEEVPIPLVYGRFRVAGNRIALHTVNSGDDQILYMLLNAGEGPIAGVGEIKLNDQPIENFSDWETAVRPGTGGQTVIPWFNQNITEHAKNIELNEVDWIVHTTTTEIDQFRVDFSAPAGLAHYKDNGDVATVTVALDCQYRRLGDAEWITLYNFDAVTTYVTQYYYTDTDTYESSLRAGTALLDSGLIQDDTTLQIVGQKLEIGNFTEPTTISGRGRSRVQRTFTSPELVEDFYEIRVRRSDAPSSDEQTVDIVNYDDVAEIVNDKVAYRHTALLAVKLRASDQVNSIPNVTYLHGGKYIKVRRYVNNVGTWTYEASNNPAWITYDILTNKRYGGGIDESRLDIDSWQEWADHCDDNSLVFNGVFDTASNVWDVLQYVLRLGHAQIVNVGTRYQVALEKADDPVMMFNVGNIVEKSFKMTWLPMTDRANEIEVTYFDSENDYERTTLKVRDPSLLPTDDVKTARITLFGCTDKQQAVNEAVFQLNLNKYITKSITFDAPVESIACTVGSQILVQHNLPNWEYSGRLEANSTVSVVNLDQEVELLDGITYRLLINYDKISRATGTVSGVAVGGGIVWLNSYDGNTNVTRAVINGVDHRIRRVVYDDGSGNYGVEIENTIGIVAGHDYTIYDTDVIIERDITNAPGLTSSVTVASSLGSAPPKYAKFMLGPVTLVKRPFRVIAINGSGHEVRTIRAIEYNSAIYNVDNNIELPIYEAPQQIGQVVDLGVYQEYEKIGNSYLPVANLYWSYPASGVYGGADIHMSVDGAPYEKVGQVDMRTLEYRHRIPVGVSVFFKVVAFDIVGRRATFAGAPTIAFSSTARPDVTTPTNLTATAIGTIVSLSWTPPTGIYDEIVVYRSASDDNGTAVEIGRTKEATFTDAAVNQGISYFYWVKAVTTDGVYSDFNAVNGTQVAPPGQVQNLGLVSPFISDRFTVRWDELEEAYDYEVQVEINSAVVRISYTGDPSYTYTWADAQNDGQINRSITVRVKARLYSGTTGSSASIIVTNPQISSAPSNLFVNNAETQYAAGWDRVGDVDVGGYIVCASQTIGFTPNINTNKVYEGTGNGCLITANNGETWYVRVAAYDIWGKDNLTFSSEVSVVIEDFGITLADLQGQISESELTASLNSRINLIDTPTTGLDDRTTDLEGAVDTLQTQVAALEGTPDFDANTEYFVDDIVAYNGSLYRCIQDTTAVFPPSPLPTDTAYWTKIGDYSSLGDAVAAHSIAISDLETTVEDSERGVVANANRLDAVQASIDDSETGLSASAQAIDNLETTVYIDQAGTLSSHTQAIQALEATASNSGNLIFQETWEDANALNYWITRQGTGELSIQTAADSYMGGKFLRIGDNSGDDLHWLAHNSLIPFDPERIYKWTVIIRRTAGTGTFYAGFEGIASDGTTYVNINGDNVFNNQHYHTTGGGKSTIAATWEVITGYTKGYGSPLGDYSGASTAEAPHLAHENVRYMRPVFIANYGGVAGTTEVGAIMLEDATADYAIDTRASITYVDDAIADEQQARATALTQLDTDYKAADAGLQTNIDAKASITYVDDVISDEQQARATALSQLDADYKAADSLIADDVTDLQNGVPIGDFDKVSLPAVETVYNVDLKIHNGSGTTAAFKIFEYTNTGNYHGLALSGRVRYGTRAGRQDNSADVDISVFTNSNGLVHDGIGTFVGTAVYRWRNDVEIPDRLAVYHDPTANKTTIYVLNLENAKEIAGRVQVSVYGVVGNSWIDTRQDAVADAIGDHTYTPAGYEVVPVYSDWGYNDLSSSKASITYVDTAVSNETTARATAISQLETDYQTADDGLQADIDLKASITYVDDVISDEQTARAESIQQLSALTDVRSDEPSYINAQALTSPRVVLGSSGDQTIRIAALEDGTYIYQNSVETAGPLDAMSVITRTASLGDIFTANKPTQFELQDRGDQVPAFSDCGRYFGHYYNRYSPVTLYFYAVSGSAVVKINNAGTPLYDFSSPTATVTVPSGTVQTWSTTVTEPAFVIIESSSDIVAFAEGNAGDYTCLLPMAREILAARYTSVIYDSVNSSYEKTSLGNSHYITSPGLVQTTAIGDSAGGDCEPAISTKMLGDTYLIAHNVSDYVVAAVEPCVITVIDSTGVVATHDLSYASRDNVGKVEVGNIGGVDPTLYSGPVRFEGTAPFMLRLNNLSDDEYVARGMRRALRDYDGLGIAAVQREAKARADKDGLLSSEYTVKVEARAADGKTAIAGIGLSVENDQSGTTSSEVAILANQFSILDPNGVDVSVPFIVRNGVVYIDETYIQDGTISTAKIGDYIQSLNYTPTSGWRIDKSGSAEFSQITIRDSSGNIVLQSGGKINWDGINFSGGSVLDLDYTGALNANYITNTSELTDGAGLGDTANWDGVSGVPVALNRAALGSMHTGGFGDVRLLKNELGDGSANPGEIRITGTTFYHPDGTKRSITNDTQLNTAWEGGIKQDPFYIIYTDESPNTRFANNFGTAVEFFGAIYDIDTDTWQAVDNGNVKYTFTPLDTDCIVAIGRKWTTAAGTGIDVLSSLIATNTNLPADGATVGADFNSNVTNIPYDSIYTNDDSVALGFNPTFSDWPDGQTRPTGWNSYGVGTPVKETTLRRIGPYAVKFVVPAATNFGIVRTVSFYDTPLPADTFVSGAFDIYIENYVAGGRPGILVDLFYNTSGSYRRTPFTAPLTTTGWQKVPFTARLNPGEQIYRLQIHLMASYTGMSGGQFQGTVIFDNLRFAFFDKSIDNTVIELADDGTLSGAGGGKVTILGLGYTGELDADNTYNNSAGSGVNIADYRCSVFEDIFPTLVPVRATVSYDDTISYFGGHSLKISATDNDGYVLLAENASDWNVIIEPGKVWLFSCYVRSSLANSAVQLRAVRNSDGTTPGGSFTCAATPGDWKRITWTLDLSADTSTRLRLRIDNDGGAGCDLWVDGIMFEERVGALSNPSSYAIPGGGTTLYDDLSGTPTSLSEISTAEGTKLTNIEDGATVGQTKQEWYDALEAAFAAGSTLFTTGAINDSIPMSTTIASADTWTFNCPVAGKIIIGVLIRDAEGGVQLALNGTTIGANLHYNEVSSQPDNTSWWFYRVGDAVEGTNTIAIWASNADGAATENIVVKATPAWDVSAVSGMLPNWNLSINGPDGKPAGIEAVESTNSKAAFAWGDSTKTWMRISHANDASVAYGWPAIPIDDKQTYEVTIRHRAESVGTTGLYLRFNEKSSALAEGKTHIGAGGTSALTDTRTTFVSVYNNGQYPGTTWQEDTYTYTPTAGAKFASFAVYHWTATSRYYDVDAVQIRPIGGYEKGATVGATWGTNLDNMPPDEQLLNKYAPMGYNFCGDPGFIKYASGDTSFWNVTGGATVSATGAEDGGPCWQVVNPTATAYGQTCYTNRGEYIPLLQGEKLYCRARVYFSTDYNGTGFRIELNEKTSAGASTAVGSWPDLVSDDGGVTKGQWYWLEGSAAALQPDCRQVSVQIIVGACTGTVKVSHVEVSRVQPEATVGADWTANLSGRPLMYRVVTKGNQATYSAHGHGLYDEDDTQIQGIGRSYTMVVFNRTTGLRESGQTYDVYGSVANATTMAAALNALDNTKIVVVYGFDEPENNRLANGLDAAMYRCGASKAVYGSTNLFKNRSAYVLIGIPGCGEGNGFEAYAGEVDDDPDAWLDIPFSIYKGAPLVSALAKTNSSIYDLDYVGELDADSTYNNTAGSGVNIANYRYSVFENIFPTLAKASTATVSLDATVSYFGGHSLKIAATGDNGYVFLSDGATNYNIPIEPGKVWLFSCYVRSNTANAAVQLYTRRQLNDTYLGYNFTCAATPGDWKRITATIDLSADTTSTRLLLRVDNEGGAGCDVWFDGIMFEERVGALSNPSTYAIPGGGTTEYDDLSGTPTSLSEISTAEGTKLNNIEDGATVGADFWDNFTGYPDSLPNPTKLAGRWSFATDYSDDDSGEFKDATAKLGYVTLSNGANSVSVVQANLGKGVQIDSAGVKLAKNVDTAYATYPQQSWVFVFKAPSTPPPSGARIVTRDLSDGWGVSTSESTYDGNGKMNVSLAFGNPSTLTDAIYQDEWHCLIVTFDKDANELHYYMFHADGSYQTSTLGTTSSFTTTARAVAIGGNSEGDWDTSSLGSGVYYGGIFSEARYYREFWNRDQAWNMARACLQSAGSESGTFAFIDEINQSNVSTVIAAGAIGDAYIGNTIQSTNFVNVTSGWWINKNGNAQFNDIYARGNIEASSLKADSLEIVERGHIAELAVGTLQIDELAVTTLKIADRAVTIPTTNKFTTLTTVANTWTEYGYLTYTATGNEALITVSMRMVISSANGDGYDSLYMDLKRDDVHIYGGTQIARYREGGGDFITFVYMDVPPAGTRRYSVDLYVSNTYESGRNDIEVKVDDLIISALEVKK